MIDPFSIIAVTATGLSVAQSLTNLVKDLEGAPDELLALSNEVWNLKLVLDDVQELERGSNRPSARKLDSINALVYQARIKLDILSSLTTQWGKISQWGDSFHIGRKDRFLWLKEKGRVIKLQSELRELRSYLSIAVGTQASTALSRMEVNIQSLVSQLHGLSAETVKRSAAAPAGDSCSASKINEIHQNQQESKELLQNMMQVISKLSLKNTADLPHTQTGTSTLEVTTSTERINASRDVILGAEKANLLSMTMTRTGNALSVCPSDCLCSCHVQTRFRTPQFLQQVTGFLLLGYSGHAVLQQQCISSCLREHSKPLQMTYFFPRWFVNRAISLSMSDTLQNNPTFNVKIRRVVPEASQLFSLSKFGDVEGIRNLFDNRLASPDDVHIRGGWTALHFAVDHGCLELCHLLLNCGADPDWEDATGTTPVEKAWRNILHLRAPPSMSEAFSVLFPGTEYVQGRRFTRLHRLVIGLENGSVEEELTGCPQSAHALDYDGWTPLHWASRRGNYTAMCLLLENGADPNQATGNEKRTSLHLAAQCNSLPCVERLLQYRRGNLFLDINVIDGYGDTPLRVSACHNCAATTATLIQYGADLNIGDRFGETPILGAVFENAHETLTQLLNAGADYTLKTTFGNTILHWAANEADLQTLVLLARAHMRGVNVDAKNVDGKTATELAATRYGVDEAFKATFERLVNKMSDGQDEKEEVISSVSGTSGAESWKSFEDSVWHEAEWAAEEDVRDGETSAEATEIGKAVRGRQKLAPRLGRGSLEEPGLRTYSTW